MISPFCLSRATGAVEEAPAARLARRAAEAESSRPGLTRFEATHVLACPTGAAGGRSPPAAPYRPRLTAGGL